MRELCFKTSVQKSLLRTMFVLAGAIVVFFWNGDNPVMLGFIVGTALSVINGVLLSVWIKRLTEWKMMLGETSIIKKAGFLFQMGFFFLRWAIIVSVLILAAETGWFDLLAVMGGLFVLPAFANARVLRLLWRREPGVLSGGNFRKKPFTIR